MINSFFIKTVKGRIHGKRGFSLVETLVAVSVFVIIALSAYKGYVIILQGVSQIRLKNTAATIANEQFEIIRNLPYVDVGIVGGLPSGKIPHTKTVVVGSASYEVTTIIRNIDDPFDGVIGGDPNDLSPADNKLIEVQVSCINCKFEPLTFTSRVAPKSLETTGNNGALFIQVFNANGEPVQGADIHIENNKATTTIVIDEVSDANGMLQIVDAPPGNEAYEISVTKDGYSSAQTYEIGDPQNPVPDTPHANVVTGQVTQVSFAIDELSDVSVSTKSPTCAPISNGSFSMKGSKMIGLDTYKYDEDHTTNASGNLNLSNIEWDTYEIVLAEAGYDLAGSNPILPLAVNPGTNQQVELILTPSEPDALLVRVKDGTTDLPLSDATVTLTKDGDESVLITGRGFLDQTDWSGGAGQSEYSDNTRFFSSDGNIEINNPSGAMKLVDFAGEYITSGELTSSTFDTGTTTNFHTFEWIPGGQPIAVGNESVRFQVATNLENNATSTWSFVGPDGLGSSYFTSPGESFSGIHNGDRYVRYKALLQTAAATSTPTVSNISFTFSSDCAPSGQVLFTNLVAGEYELKINKPGFQEFSIPDLVISKSWQAYDVTLNP